MNSNNTILSLRSVSKEFPGTKALSDINLDIIKGEIHALVGENGAGKSTMMNIIGGVFPLTSGTVMFEGQKIEKLNPMKASAIGIGFVHQEMSLCPHLSVAENVFVGRIPVYKGGVVNAKKLNADCAGVLSKFKTTIKPKDKVSVLTVAEQQIVEITKAISLNCKLLILDEPTSSLTGKEAEELFEIVRQLRKEGISIIYISHRLSEITELCDRVTILRDGSVIATRLICDIDTNMMISMMVGRKLENLYPPKGSSPGRELLRVENAGGTNYKDISFRLKEGEILGFAGLVGAGRSELMRGICGIDKLISGKIYLMNQRLDNRTYRKCLDKGLVYMTEDRKLEGLFLQMTVRNNVVASILQRANKLLVKESNTDQVTKQYVEFMNIKITSPRQLCGDLSGGNQQKVLIAKNLAIKPKVLVVDEPTRGIDVGAKFEVYKILRNLCKQGIGIIMISSDLPEVIGMCDRVEVMYEGQLSGELNRDEITEEGVMRYAAAMKEG